MVTRVKETFLFLFEEKLLPILPFLLYLLRSNFGLDIYFPPPRGESGLG